MFENARFAPDRVHAGASFLAVIARLRPHETIEHAQLELNSLDSLYAKTFGSFYDAKTIHGPRDTAAKTLVGALRTSILCSCCGSGNNSPDWSVINLKSRTLYWPAPPHGKKEMAIRGALGASRAGKYRVRQLLTESLLLSFIGGGIGLALLAISAHKKNFLRLLPPRSLPRLDEVAVNARVIWFSLTDALRGDWNIAFGLVPALQISGDKLQVAFEGRHAVDLPAVHTLDGVPRSALVVAASSDCSGAGEQCGNSLLKEFWRN